MKIQTGNHIENEDLNKFPSFHYQVFYFELLCALICSSYLEGMVSRFTPVL